MRIAYIAAGAAGMYCGTCIHGNTLAAALLDGGHDVALVPTYTPIRTDEDNVSIDRIFYGAISVYLEQKLPFLSRLPWFADRLLNRPGLLAWVSRSAASTDPGDLGALTLSVLQGRQGAQRGELEKLVGWLQGFQPEVIHLSQCMFLGFARHMKEVVGVPIVCSLQGEDLFLESLPAGDRTRVLQEISRRHGDVDAFVTNSRFYARAMSDYLSIPRQKMHVVPLGISLKGHPVRRPERREGRPLVVGYLARICPEKGLHLLVEAFRLLSEELGPGAVCLKIAGYLGKRDRAFLRGLRRRLETWGLGGEVEIWGEVDRQEKLRFLRQIDVLSVPTTYREPKGLFVLEALASGVPVVQPRHGAFPELLEATRGGVLVDPDSPAALAAGIRSLLEDAHRRRQLGERGREVVHARFHDRAMAEATVQVYRSVLGAHRRLAGSTTPTVQ